MAGYHFSLRASLLALALAAASGVACADTVLITGANSGIGLEFAKEYAARGWTVIATHRRSSTPETLAALQAEHKNVRIEACETCRRYVKSIDLTIDARPVPAVDDLISLSMDLWATESGYTRLEPGLAGI